MESDDFCYCDDCNGSYLDPEDRAHFKPTPDTTVNKVDSLELQVKALLEMTSKNADTIANLEKKLLEIYNTNTEQFDHLRKGVLGLLAQRTTDIEWCQKKFNNLADMCEILRDWIKAIRY